MKKIYSQPITGAVQLETPAYTCRAEESTTPEPPGAPIRKM